jgi:anti-anti-sigma factor
MAERRYPVIGAVDLANCQDLRHNLTALINATSEDLVLDCAALTFIDSTGVEVFMHTKRLLEERGRSLHIENLTGNPRRPFQLLGVTEFLEVEPEPV